MEKKMKVEIWSDIMCPFCYIGKRRFEAALEEFNHKTDIEIEWKSYQLMPGLTTQADKNINEFLVEQKGIPLAQAKTMNDQAGQMAEQVGLTYNFDKMIPANTFKAHQLIHFAKEHAKQNEAEEVLFHSYFMEGKNMDDIPTLLEIGTKIGLDPEALKTALENGTYANDVRADINEAQQIGVSGVPFFVFNRKYAVSGAQESETFLSTLEKSFTEYRKG